MSSMSCFSVVHLFMRFALRSALKCNRSHAEPSGVASVLHAHRGAAAAGHLPLDAAPMLRPDQANAWNDRMRPEGFAYVPANEAGALPRDSIGQPVTRGGRGGGDAAAVSLRPRRAAAQAARQRNYANDEFEFMDE